MTPKKKGRDRCNDHTRCHARFGVSIIGHCSGTDAAIEKFQYGPGDIGTLDSRWEIWYEQFKLAVSSARLDDQATIKPLFLSQMGTEAYCVYKTKKKPDHSDTFAEVAAIMNKQFVNKRSELLLAAICLPFSARPVALSV